MEIDTKKKSGHNQDSYLLIGNGEQVIKINKRDLRWTNTGDHTHHYLPDFEDEWEKAIALKCAVSGCVKGRMQKKEGKPFMDWLEQHRSKQKLASSQSMRH